jgi:hypothetical protein
MGNTKAYAEYLPSTTLASGNAAPAAGASDSAWGAGVDSSAGGVTSSSATTVEGSSPSQDRSVDFLQKYTNWLSIKIDYYTKYYSGRLSTYKLDRTIVTVGAPKMLAMSTSPASAGASSCASAAAASSAATVAGAVLSCASAATTPSAAAAAGSVLS